MSEIVFSSPSKGRAIRVLDFAKQLARDAAELLQGHFGRLNAGDFKMKSRMDPVTIADTEIEEFLCQRIGEAYPKHRILAEEFNSENEDLQGDLWVIDPIDGTNNYLHGIPNTCISIAFCQKGEVKAAVVYAPLLKELYTAQRGQGAYLNGDRIETSKTEELSRSMLCTGYADLRKHGDETNLGVWKLMAPRVSGIRRYGSAALDLCWLAAGRFDGFWERSLSPWDIAAGSLIVEEARGVIVNLGKAPSFTPFDGSVVAANPALAPELYECLCSAIEEVEKGNPMDLSDRRISLGELKDEISGFVEERAWSKFHNPKNVSMSIAIEAAELMELFQWLDFEQANSLAENEGALGEIEDELADILAYVLSLANYLDIDVSQAFKRKMEKNRKKYPVELVWGKWEGKSK